MNHLEGAQVLKELLKGNSRYVEKRRTYPNQTSERQISLVNGQNPHTIVLGCSDSRVPPEHIFDQGLGDLFVIRVAGNVIDDIVLASIEYAAEHLHAPLLIVLGHTNCGAVQASLEQDELDGHLPSIANAIEEAVEETSNLTGDVLNETVKAHARITASHLRESEPVLKKLVETNELTIVASIYDLETGKVEIL